MASPSLQTPASTRVLSGLEFLGRYDASGYEGEQYLIRRPDGQLLRVSQLLYLVVQALSVAASPDEAASLVSDAFGRQVSTENIAYLVDNKLLGLGVFESSSTAGVAAPAAAVPAAGSKALGLRFRRPLLPASAHLRVTRGLEPLFAWRIVAAVVLALAAADAWLLATASGSVLAGATQTVGHPLLLLFLIAAFSLSNVFHEFGHAAATTYGGATPGPMGVGVYIAMPVFYTDVTDSYRLSRAGRLCVDLGGVYFNAIIAILATAVYLASGFRPVLLFVVLIQMEALIQFLPFVRLDGYYVVADLIGIPDPFAFVKPVIARALWRPAPSTSPSLASLTTRARRAITSWVALTVPILAAELTLTALMAPRVAPAYWRSLSHTAEGLARALNGAHAASAIADVVNILLLAVGPLGLSLLAGSGALRAGQALRRRYRPRWRGGEALSPKALGPP